MKVVTKIVAGYSFLALLMASLLFYLTSQFQNLGITVQPVGQFARGITVILIVAAFLWSIWSFQIFSHRIQELKRGAYPLDASREDEFTPLIEELNRLARALDEVENAKKEFFSHAAHELKGPLASLQESIQLLLDPAHGPITSKQKRLLEIQLSASKRLLRMLSDLADLSRMEARALDYFLTDHEVTVLVKQLVTEHESRLHQRQVTLQLDLRDVPVYVQADAARLRQAITHLVDNSLKFSPSGAPVRISAQFSPELPKTIPSEARQGMTHRLTCQGFVLITVADRGPGVPEAEKEKIFQKFYQGKSENRTFDRGLGIGLTLCRLIAEAHQGSVWVEDDPEGGSRFVLLLPGSLAQATFSN
jgi:signal transduction histidine kinase